jgi:outer membrane protein OmpA-like peptidoglycan-associated protein
MKKNIIFLLTMVATVVLPQITKAQYQTVFPFMNNVSQSSYFLPSNMPKSNLIIGLPALSNVYAGFLNDGPKIKDIYSGNTLYLSRIPENVKDRGAIYGFESQVDLISIRFRTGKMFWGIGSSLSTSFNARVPKDLLDVAINGNASFVRANKKADFSDLAVDGLSYQDYYLSWTGPITEKIILGGRFRYLQGIASVQTKRSNSSLSTSDPDNYGQAVGTDYLINTSTGNFDTDSGSTNSTNDVFKSAGNTGFGIDIGGTYNHNEKWSFFGSLIDVGAINWNAGVNNFEGRLATTNFNGFKIEDIQDTSDKFDFGGVGDTLESRFKSVQTKNAYRTTLSPKVYIGTSYKYHEKGVLSAGLLTKFYKGVRPAVIVNATHSLGRWLQASVSYSGHQGSLANLGAGLALKGGPFQLFVVADNLFAFNKIGNNTNTTARAGLNLVFGGNQKDTDKDGIPDKKDNCPNDFGLKELNGCPDKDKDGIADKEDDCPFVAGLKEFKGCPDTDADGIPDKDDKCPKVAGTAQCNGCPDADKDGVADTEDACPDKPGLKENQGCPDSDGDGTFDHKDKCPTEPGKVENQGCPDPDRDKDGIPDATDACPDAPGSIEHKGCPDTDADGVYDDTDKCIKVAGPADNAGCPYGDMDKDGILDKDDACPDVLGIKENKGCPDVDTDGDSVVDRLDECPKTPGTVVNNGCPELKKEEKAVLKTAFSNLEFETDKDIIKPSSYSSLDELAKLLVANPDYKLKISGHTDKRGKEPFNKLLSKNRAGAVKVYLLNKGIESSRFIVESFGSTKPIASNKTPQGQAKNRRVEMKVIFE